MEYKINDIITEIAMGPFGSNIKKSCFIESGFPVLNGSNLTGIKLNDESFNYVSNEKAFELKKAIAIRGDIVITHRGTLGQIAYIPDNSKYEKYLISQSQFRIRCNREIVLPQYLVYFFHTKLGQYKLLANKSQVGVPSLAQPTTYFKKIVVNIPSLDIQNRVCRILDAIESKIELNIKINETLQSISKLLFKHWFIDYEFPNEEGLSYKSSGGEMVDSELGMIPKAWNITTLDKVGTFKNGKGIKENSRNLNGKNLIFGSNGVIGKTNEILQNDPCIIVGRVGAYCGSVQLSLKPCWVTDNAIIGSAVEIRYLSYLYLTLLNSSLRDKAGGSAQPLINQSILNNIKIVLPPFSLIEKYHHLVFGFIKEIESNIDQNTNISNIRDTLLPKLMNGEIDLTNLEINE